MTAPFRAQPAFAPDQAATAPRPLHLVVGGLGSVGGKLLESVVRTTRDPHAGFRLGRVTLLDRDALEPDNLMRHEALPHELGRKVEWAAARVRALAPAPAPELEALDGSLLDPAVEARASAAVAACDVVVSAFDNPRALFALGALAARHGKPLLVAEVISGGIGLWLLAAHLSPEGPCVLCLAAARGERAEPADRTPAAELDYADPAAVVREARVPADDWTCGVAASLLAGLVVDAARRGGLPDPATPPLRLVALRAVGAPAEVAPFFRAPLQVTDVPAPRRPDCPQCAARTPTSEEHARHLAFFGDDVGDLPGDEDAALEPRPAVYASDATEATVAVAAADPAEARS